MKRYWLFGSFVYYSTGGMCDFLGSFGSAEEASAAANDLMEAEKIEWWHVFDTVEGAICQESEENPYGFVDGEDYPCFSPPSA